MALLLPIGILSAWLVIPNHEPVKILKPREQVLLPVIAYTAGTEHFQARVRTNTDRSAWQLEWINKTILTTPSAVIYKIKGETFAPESAELIGRIETQGRYIFSLQPDSTGWVGTRLILYDFIHAQRTDSIKF
ncbi:MAG: hypothetical protein NTW29_17230 [Bacteroidetes bacterium]|nr:hypothetical protein [Bacteroidota bacterium]